MKVFDFIKYSLGGFIKELNLFPVFYVFFIYISFYIFPFKIFNEKTFYHLWSYEEHLAEHFQFILYLLASIFAFINVLKNKYKLLDLQNICWLLFFTITLFISIEEISFLEIFKGSSFEFLREINVSNEINIHNSKYLQSSLFYFYIFINLFLGFFGWKYISKIEAIPKKKHSLFFLFCSLSFIYSYIYSYVFTELNPLTKMPFMHDEIFEFLMALGLFLHSFESFRKYTKS